MVYDPHHSLQPYIPFSDFRMSVFAGAERIETVVEMDGFQPGKSDYFIKMIQHLIKAMNNIISSVPDMSGIKAYSHMIGQLHPVKDLPKLLELPANLTAFPRHGFQKNRSVLVRC